MTPIIPLLPDFAIFFPTNSIYLLLWEIKCQLLRSIQPEPIQRHRHEKQLYLKKNKTKNKKPKKNQKHTPKNAGAS